MITAVAVIAIALFVAIPASAAVSNLSINTTNGSISWAPDAQNFDPLPLADPYGRYYILDYEWEFTQWGGLNLSGNTVGTLIGGDYYSSSYPGLISVDLPGTSGPLPYGIYHLRVRPDILRLLIPDHDWVEYTLLYTEDVSGPRMISVGMSGTSTGATINWTAEAGAERFEVALMGTNGLERKWINVTTTGISFVWSTAFPGQNVYTGWTAFVRAYNSDGVDGPWMQASPSFTLALPEVVPLDFTVSDVFGSALTTGTRTNIREVLVEWPQYTAPNITNFDPNLITFELIAQMSGDSAEKYEVTGINNGTTSINVPVGELGKVISYHFTVDVFYDGVKLSTVIAPDSFDLVIDLKGPAAVTLDTPLLYRPNYLWDFNWTRASETDPQYGADFKIESVEGTLDETVVGTWSRSYSNIASTFGVGVDPRVIFDKIFGRFRVTVTPFDLLGNRGTPVSQVFAFDAPTLSPTITSFNSIEVEWTSATEAVSYDVEIRSENGHYTWLAQTDLSESIDWEALFPGANVYKLWKAKVRAYDRDGNVGAWSAETTFDFQLPQMTTFAYDVLHIDGATANINAPMTDRELLVRWPMLANEPEFMGEVDFLNWDYNKVTFDLEVDIVSSESLANGSSWYYTLIQNQYAVGHIVPVGIEGEETSYSFWIRPLYDGVPLMYWVSEYPYIIDLKGPLAVSLSDVAPVRPPAGAYSWPFVWAAAEEEDSATRYDLIIERLEGTDGTVDASVTISGETQGVTVNPEAYFDYIFGRFRYTVIPYDLLGNAGIPVSKVFTFAAPTLSPTITSFDEVDVTWSEAVEAVSYDVEIRSENGHHLWEGQTDLVETIDWAVLFPDCNVYKTWQARVRAHDRDGNIGAWSDWVDDHSEFNFPLPVQPAMPLIVNTKYNGLAPTDGTAINDRYLLALWTGFTSISPLNFINWDLNKVTYQLDVIRVPGIPFIQVEMRDSDLSPDGYLLQVGEEGDDAMYYIRVQAMYEGVPLSVLSQYGPVIVDLRGPEPVWLADVVTARPIYSWEFDWVPYVEADPAVSYDLIIDRLEAEDGTIDATVKLHLVEEITATIDPTEYFDYIFGTFKYSVIGYDALGNASVPRVKEFTFPAPALTAAISSFDSTAVAWSAVTEAVKYDVEIRSNNGYHMWYGLTATSQAIDWATLFPATNVYQVWSARVRAYDVDGNVGTWSDWYEFNFSLPQIMNYDFSVLKLDFTDAPAMEPMNDRQLLVRFQKMASGPEGFINWDPDLVTFSLEVDCVSMTQPLGGWWTAWHNVTLANLNANWTNGHIVPVGIEDDVVAHAFSLKVLYDDQPMSASYTVKGPYFIDLKGPGAAVLEEVETSRPDYNWLFEWSAPEGPIAPPPGPNGINSIGSGAIVADGPVAPFLSFDPVKFDLVVRRLEALDGTVDAEVWIEILAEEGLPPMFFNMDPEYYFDYIFGSFEYQVISYDNLGNASYSEWMPFTFAAPGLTTVITSFDSAAVAWSSASEAVSYDVEIRSENGHHTWEGQTDLTEEIDWAALFPNCNVYVTWQSRVRAHDRDGHIGLWSEWIDVNSQFIFPLPKISEYLFDVQHVSGTDAAVGVPMNDRELLVQWDRFINAPEGFINWDPNKVTFDLEVDNASTQWYYVLVQNLWPVGHVVPVGVDGTVQVYKFYLRPLYDGVPMMSVWQEMGYYIIDLLAPLQVDLNDVVTERPDYSWAFSWTAAVEDDPATSFDLIIERLEAADGTVDAAVTFHQTGLAKTIDPADYFDYIFATFRYTVIPYDALMNAGTPVSKTFEFAEPGLAMGAVTLVDTGASWGSVAEAVKYDVQLKSDNGTYSWNDVTGLSVAIDWATMFPGANVYQTWQARVRAYDMDGNYGLWSAWASYSKPFPANSAVSFNVLRTSDGAAAPIGVNFKEEALRLTWSQYAMPAGFINWDPDLITFELVATESVDGLPAVITVKQLMANVGSQSVEIEVGVPGEIATYKFKVRAFYDGELLNDGLESSAYLLDLEGPFAVRLNAEVLERPVYRWSFSWARPAQTDPATSYDLIIDELESTGTVVESSLIFHLDATSKSIYPQDHFDQIFGWFRYTVIPYDALGNAGDPASMTFLFEKPALTMGAVTLNDTRIDWDDVIEAVKYDVELKSDNGTYNWYGVTATEVMISWETMFPGANVYQVWQARVKAYDRDGNSGLWSTWANYDKLFPAVNPLTPSIYLGSDPDTHAPLTPMNEDELYVWWPIIGKPAGFLNWDQDLISYELVVGASNANGASSFKYHITNYELTSVRVDVGVQGLVTSYSFHLNVFYDGELLLAGDTSAGPYIIDLKAPANPSALNETIAGVNLWRFWWTAPADSDLAGYIFELQKYDALNNKWAPACASDEIAAGTNETFVDPLMLYWSVFGNFRWRVMAYDNLGNMSEGVWEFFAYTLDAALAPRTVTYELLGEHNTLDMGIEYATAGQVRFHWNTPSVAIPGIDMGMVFYKVELLVGTEDDGMVWEPEVTYLMPWIPSAMKAKFDVGESGLTKHYKGRVQAIYLSEYSASVLSEEFAIDLERPEFIEGAEAPSYSSTDEEYPSWLFTWDIATDEEVGLGGFLFVLERLEGDTTHAIAMIDLPVEYEEPEDDSIGAYSFGFEEGKYLLEMDPFEYVETIDGIFRYTVIPYDRLENLGGPIAGEFTSVWSGGGNYGTYPFINLYDNWMGEKQLIGTVNNNTYATITFDIFGLEGYTLEFRLNGTLLVEGTDFRLIDSPYGSDLYYLVLLESVRDMIQADDMGELEIYAYVEEDDIVVQFTVDAFSYIYLNQRTGFGFGRFRPALND